MKTLKKKTIKHILFTAGGALLGLFYYKAIGCPSGTCPITSSVAGTALYGALLGFWLSWVTSGGCCCGGGSCSIEQKDED